MRAWLTGLALVFAACGRPEQSSIGSLSFERTQSNFIEISDKESTTKLFNTDFKTVRRVERFLSEESSLAFSSAEDIVVRVQEAAHDLNPETQLQLLHLRRGDSFYYATFQQVHDGREVVGSKLILRLNSQGHWITASSTLVHPSLLKSTPSASKEALQSSYWIQVPHQLLDEKSVILPHREVDGSMGFYSARQFILQTSKPSREIWLWIDEQAKTPLTFHEPAKNIYEFTASGTVYDNSPNEAFDKRGLPHVTLTVQGENTISLYEFDSAGQLNWDTQHSGNPRGRVTLENSYFLVSSPQLNADGSIELKQSGVEVDESIIIGQGTIPLNIGFSPEETNVFYWLEYARNFVESKLHYDGMNFQLLAVTNDPGDPDNAYFFPYARSLGFGGGGLLLNNTAYSRDIIAHEYGHALTHSIYGLYSSYEFDAMNEAYSDYFAAALFEDPIIGEGSFHPSQGRAFLRNVNNNFVYPKDYTGMNFHRDGQLFSGALWNLRNKLGEDLAHELIHEARLAQPKTIREFLLELLAIDEQRDDSNPLTPSPHKKAITESFFKKGLFSHVQFEPAQKEEPQDLSSYR